MKKIENKTLFSILILLAGAILTIWFMPRKSDSLEYEVNRPWKYPLLTAPFDIAVPPDSINVEHAIDSIKAAFVPVYKNDKAISARITKGVTEALTNEGSLASDRIIRIKETLNRLLDDGIIDNDVYNQITGGHLPEIKRVNGNMVSAMSTAKLRSPKSAYIALRDAYTDSNVRNAFDHARVADFIEPNMLLDDEMNERLLKEQYLKVSAPSIVIQQGARIIEQGERVTPQLYKVLKTYEQKLAERGGHNGNGLYRWLGKIIYVALMFMLLGLYLVLFRRKLFSQPKVLAFLTGIVTAFSICAFLVSGVFTFGLYVVPLTMIAIMLTVFFDAGMALFVSILTSMICAVIAAAPLEFIAMQFVGCTIAVVALKEMSRRSQLVRTAGFIFVGYVLTYMAVTLMLTSSFSAMDVWMLGALTANIVFLSFAYVLIFVFERWLGFTSLVGLVELSDINHPLLRELSKECPGTFQHSMAVSNLAAEAAAKVGANVQLIRAGALYHDIGKIDNPAFFTENQHGVNPHDALDALQSARIITGHVTAGLRRAEKAKLPKVIRDFIAQHHGKGVARYFYITYCNQHPDEEVDRAPFTYVGPNPQTLEASILMMADAVEAASRSLKNYDRESIASLVNKIIDSQVSEGLHNDSPLAFRDVQTIKESFIQRLLTIYHSRIAYPTARKPQ